MLQLYFGKSSSKLFFNQGFFIKVVFVFGENEKIYKLFKFHLHSIQIMYFAYLLSTNIYLY